MPQERLHQLPSWRLFWVYLLISRPSKLLINLLPLHLRRRYQRHQHRNPKNNLKLRRLLSQNQSADLRFANQNRVNSSPGSRSQLAFRNRTGYPNLFDRLMRKP